VCYGQDIFRCENIENIWRVDTEARFLPKKFVPVRLTFYVTKQKCRPGSLVGIVTGYVLNDPRIESGGGRFSGLPDRLWGPTSLEHNGYRIFPGGKVRPGRTADLSPSSSAAVMEE